MCVYLCLYVCVCGCASYSQVQEAVERERLKNMTDEERRVWEAANPKQAPVKDKKKWKFLQKYWHKGAFFQVRTDVSNCARACVCACV